MPSDLLSNVKDLLSRELELCKTLRTMISRELEAIVLDGNMDALLRVLDQKEEVISQLQLLADSWRDTLANTGVRTPNTANMDGMGARILALFPEDVEIPILLRETKQVADSILKAEEEAKMELEKHAAGLRAQLATKAHGRNVAASYAKMGGSII
ncbi:MAG: flagellar export chaperone FlgN [Synergistaceae bacterium]|nr:flagellar export chaperone FlgN [Synergistaceae bacterium]